MFSKPRPQFISLPEKSTKLFGSLQNIRTASSKELKAAALVPLKPMGQGKGFAIGYFEQGILSGATVFLSIILPAVGYGTYFVGRKCFEYAVKGR